MSKSQSAMEYLMTYGWAILIIAVVLGTLYSLGVFGNPLGTNLCLAASGFLCKSPVFTSSSTLSITLGQAQGFTMYNIEAACTASSSSNGEPSPMSALGSVQSSGSWTSILNTGTTLTQGQTIPVNGMPCYDPSGNQDLGQPIGTIFTGYIWLNYTRAPGAPSPLNPWYTQKISVLDTKVITLGPPAPLGIVYDPTSYSGTSDVVYDSNMVSSGLVGAILTTGNITVYGGVNLNTNGDGLISGKTFTNNGVITTGNSVAGGAGVISCSGGGPACPGTSLTSSYGGSGGSGGSNGNDYSFGGVGGATLVLGGAQVGPSSGGLPGSTPAAPIMSNANIIVWYGSSLQYLGGAGGGGGGNLGTGDAVGGSGGNGIYIQAKTIIAGTIASSGGAGGPGSTGGAGGGGGGVIMLAYSSGYTAGTYTDSGGAGGTGRTGGSGGGGQVVTYNYGASAPIAP